MNNAVFEAMKTIKNPKRYCTYIKRRKKDLLGVYLSHKSFFR